MTEGTSLNHVISLENQIEALLFVASNRVASQELAEFFEKPVEEIDLALLKLDEHYRSGKGLRLQWHSGRVQVTTAPELSSLIERFLGSEKTSRLSRAGLETLSIVAYRQPVTRPGIEAIRGVNSDGVIKNLLSKGLIEESGRIERPGRPILYITTDNFLHYFGISSLSELPPLETTGDNPFTNRNKVLKE